MVRNSKFEEMVDVAKATIKKYEKLLVNRAKPPLLLNPNDMTSPYKGRVGSTGKKSSSGQYLGRRTRTRENSQSKKLLNGVTSSDLRRSNKSLNNQGDNLSAHNVRASHENRLNYNQECFDRYEKLHDSITKYKQLCQPHNYEAKMQGQILDFELKNLKQSINKIIQTSFIGQGPRSS